MASTGNLLLELFVIFAGGKLLAELVERWRQPSVVGEILAGVLLGLSLLGLVHPSELTQGLAEVGAIFLLFTVGLEIKPRDLLHVGRTATAVATLGVLVPVILGFYCMKVMGHGLIESIFVGAAMVATSGGITARVLADAGMLSSHVARIMLAAAVVDDILGMIVLAVVSSLSSGQINYVSLAVVGVEAVVFSLLIVFFGSRVVGRFHPNVAKLRSQNARLFSPSFSASVCRWRRSILEWPRSSELSWLAWPWLPTASRGACERMRIPSWYSSRRSFCAAGCSGVPKDNGTIQCSFHGIGHLSAGSFEQAD